MNQETLRWLRCPTCGSGFKLDQCVAGSEESIETGLIRCGCKSARPILERVAILDERAAEAIVPLLEAGDESGLLGYLEQTHHLTPDLYRREPATLSGALDALDRGRPLLKEWHLQMRLHHSTPKYQSFLPLLARLQAMAPRRILDIGCGAGHFAWNAVTYAGAREVCAIDVFLPHLFLARWMFEQVPEVCLVHADAAGGLPVQSEMFDAVLSSDMIHYVRDQEKGRVFQETARVLRREGVAIFNHVHNAFMKDVEPAQGFSLEPARWRELFEPALGRPCVIFSDADLRGELAGQPPVMESTSEELEIARSLTLSSRALPVQDVSKLLGGSLARSIVNPIYSVRVDGPMRQLKLVRDRQSDFFHMECLYGSSPPPEFTIELGRLGEARYRARLRCAGVVIDPPARMTDRRVGFNS